MILYIHRTMPQIGMNIKTAQKILLIAITLLLVSLTAVNATEDNQTGVQDNYPTMIEQTSTQLQTQAVTEEKDTIKTENNKNQTRKTITKKQLNTKRGIDETIDTILSIKFLYNPNDEFSSENHLATHIDEEYTIDITLTEDQQDIPIDAQIQLYHENNITPDTIQLNQGHAQKTYTTTSIGMQDIYAQYAGDQQYNPSQSQTITLDSESYLTTITMNEIDNQPINSTITVEGYLYYNENIPLTNATIIIALNNTQMATATTNQQGKYTTTVNLENVPAQEYAHLTAQYNSPTDKYADADTFCNFDIEKLENTITTDITQANTVATPVTITAITNSSYRQTINVTITDDNNNTVYSNNTITGDNGEFTIEYVPTKAGIYHATIEAPEDDNYQNKTINLDFEVEIAFLYLELEDFYESLVMDNVSFTGYLVNENDDPVPNVPIEISTDDAVLTTVVTDAQGRFNFTQYRFTSMMDDDFITVYFYIEDTEDYDGYYDYVSYYLSRRNVNISMHTDSSVKINHTLHINGNVQDSYNSSVPEGSVSIFINKVEKQSNIAIDATGNYETDINVGEDYLGLTQLEVKALFVPADTGVYYSENYNQSNITHEMIQTRMEIHANDTQVNQNANITIILLDEYDNRLNETINLVVRDKNHEIIYEEDLQLENGTKTINITLEDEGRYYISAQYNGKKDIYTANSTEDEISATKKPTIITLNSIANQVYVNDTISISGTLTDIDGQPLNNVNVTIEIINATDTNTTKVEVANGEYNTAFKPLKIADNITVRVSFIQNGQYLGNYTTKSFKVVKRNTTVNINALPQTIRYEDTITITGNVTDNHNQQAASGSVQIWINDKHTDTITLENGQFTSQYHIVEVGENQQLKVIYIENDAYNTSNNTVNFEIQPLATQLNINNIEDTLINHTITINGTLKDENGKNITGQLTVKINNQTINEQIIAQNGVFQFDYTPADVGTYTVNITFTPTQYYTTTSNTATFNSQKATLNIENTTITGDNRENTITVNITLTANTNIDITSIPVTITVGQQEYTQYPDENATIIIETGKLVPDDYQISVHINQTQYTQQLDENLQTINIAKDTPTINLKEISTAVYSENIQIEGNLTDSYGRLLNNTSLTIKIADQTYELTTDENGTFKQTTNSFKAGTNTINITVPETAYLNQATLSTTFNAQKENTIITFDETNRTLPQENLNISGKLTDKNNNPLSNKKVTVTVNNKKYTATTNAQGRFNITIKKAKLGTYQINATFTDENYNTSFAQKTVNVTKLQVSLTVENIKSAVGEDILLRAYLVDELGNVVNGGNIVFKINGRTLRMDDRFDTDMPDVHKFTVQNGIVEYSIPAELYLSGAMNFTASFSGSSLYESAKSNVASVEILLRDAKINVITQPVNVRQHENITLRATIEDLTENTTRTLVNDDSYVIFKINDVTLKDESGNIIFVPVVNNTAEYNYNIAVKSAVDNQNNTREYNVTAVYVNNNYSLNIQNSTVFVVEKSEVNINVTSIEVAENNLRIKANLTDYTGVNIIGENKICIKINGITYKEEEINRYYYITDGIIDINDIDVTGITVKSVEIVTGERQAYYSARKTLTVTA